MINENPNSYNKHHNWNELENWKMNYIADYNINFCEELKHKMQSSQIVHMEN